MNNSRRLNQATLVPVVDTPIPNLALDTDHVATAFATHLTIQDQVALVKQFRGIIPSEAKMIAFRRKPVVSIVNQSPIDKLPVSSVFSERLAQIVAAIGKIILNEAKAEAGDVQAQDGLATWMKWFGRVSYLQLETLLYRPVGTQRTDELVKTILLPPSSHVELVKRSWSKTITEFEESFAQIAEEERESSKASNSELAQSSSEERSRDITMNASFQANAKWPVYSAGVRGEAGFKSTLRRAQEASSRVAMEASERAAARSRREHKLTYSTTVEAGEERASIERFSNPSNQQALLIRLWKLVKEWEIVHLALGARLLVEVMVRNPGSRLRKSPLLEEFDEQSVPPVSLQEPVSPPPGAPELPPKFKALHQEITFTVPNDPSEGPSDRRRWFRISNPDPAVYELYKVMATADEGRVVAINDRYPPVPADQLRQYLDTVEGTVTNWPAGVPSGSGGSGEQRNRRARRATVTAEYRRKREWEERWIKEAQRFQVEFYRARWQAERASKQAEQRNLEAESTVPPAQVLRREEREELFSAIIGWLREGRAEPDVLTSTSPEIIRQYEGLLEWDAAGHILYPSWWDEHAFKDADELERARSIRHPDLARQEFLKASWARAMVPVELGREMDLLLRLFPGESQQLQLALKTAVDEAIRALRAKDAAATNGAVPRHPLRELRDAWDAHDAGASKSTHRGGLDDWVVPLADGLATLLEAEGLSTEPEDDRAQEISRRTDYTPMDEVEPELTVLPYDLADQAQQLANAKEQQEKAIREALITIFAGLSRQDISSLSISSSATAVELTDTRGNRPGGVE